MARPERKTVDYFPHYISDGKKMFSIEHRHGNDGYATWFKVLESLASTDNHFLNLNDSTDLMYLSAKCKVTESKLIEILSDLCELGEIDSTLWSCKVIYSAKFIESIQDAYSRRSNKCMDYGSLCKHLLGLCIPKLRETIEKTYNNTQSKVYNSIQKQSKEEKLLSRKKLFASTLEPFVSIYGKDLLNDFYKYWTEPNKTGTKFRQELEKTWSLDRRLETWVKNDKTFKPNPNGTAKQPVDFGKQDRDFIERVMGTSQLDTDRERDSDESFTSFENA